MDAVFQQLPDDPRIDDRFVTSYAGSADRSPAIVVGVAHDHPSSIFRVSEIAAALQPDIVALELPAASVPLFKRFAADEQSPPEQGGEMSAAIQASNGARIVGIDIPNGRSVFTVLQQARRTSLTWRSLHRLVSDVLAISKDAIRQWFTAGYAWMTASQVTDDSAMTYEVTVEDDPVAQAKHEHDLHAKSTTLFTAFEKPAAAAVLDTARERSMAGAIESLRMDGTVLAVVGNAHLAAVDALLSE